MLGGNEGAFLARCSYEGSPGKHICASQKPSRALVDGGDGILREKLGLCPGDGEMVSEVGGHLATT